MEKKQYTPIVFFVYNRPDHTRQTLESLAANYLASDSELFIYSDAPKNQGATESVQTVRSYIKKIQGFKSVTIVERDTNFGLANSIIDGVTTIVNRYGKVIVLEDDNVTSPYFLKFMNKALDYYENEKEVWHISGWNYPIDSSGLSDAFFWRTMNCWGWATWKNRWQHFEKDVDKTIASFTKKDIYRFNINGVENMWGQMLANKTGKLNTWATFWYAAVFQKNGLCINPSISFVRNIGLDGSGIHCGKNSIYSNDLLCQKDIEFSKLIIEENKIAVKRIMQFLKKQKKNIIYRVFARGYRIIKRIVRKTIFIIKNLIFIFNKKTKIALNCTAQWYGTDYGGFYICHDMIALAIKKNQEIIIYSAGVGEDISFDEALLKEFHGKVFAFDPTPKSISWIQKRKIPTGFMFFPYGISDRTEKKQFYLPKNRNHVSGSIFTHENTSLEDTVIVQMKSLEDIAKENQHTYIDILKMDIEGSEFDVVENFPTNIVFGQILIEFHERFFTNGKELFKKTLKILKENGYYCFAISKHGDEYSFMNKNEYKKISFGKK